MDKILFASGLVLLLMAVDDYLDYKKFKENRRLIYAVVSAVIGVLNILGAWLK